MTDKELRKLSRVELIEMLLTQGKELDRVQRLLDDANRQLESRKIAIESSGSIAEAALKLNGIFEAAQQAADQYLENVSQVWEDYEAVKANAETEAEKIIAKAKQERMEMLKRAEYECDLLVLRKARSIRAQNQNPSGTK